MNSPANEEALNSEAFIVGMDFGTTNSGMAVYNAETQTVDILPLDEANSNPRVARTAIYITNDQKVHIGRDAVDTYLEQNVGRPVRLERVWVGEIEVRAEDMFYVDDVYVFSDVLSPGRLFLSIKSGLREDDYLGTVVGSFYYPLEDIIALYLTVTKMRAEKLLGRQLKQVLLGRPVRFAFDAEKDRLAQRRLLDAALRAGYETVYFQYEPIAAAYDYAQKVIEQENLLIFDFGGGTLDVTVMRLNGDGAGKHQILATGGIPVAGDVFDQKIARAKLPRHFGEGSAYRTDHGDMPVPGWIYDIFADWQRMLELQSPDNRQILADIAETSYRPREIEALITLVADNYGLQMFDAVEVAKRRLSEDMGTLIHFQGPNFNIRQMLTRTDFETIIREEVRAIDTHIDEMIANAGLSHGEIDVVVRTGGSAEIPVFRNMLDEKFANAKIRQVDTFSSVTAGLGVIAEQIAQGSLTYQAFTRDDLQTHSVEKSSNVSSANLDLLKKRISLQEGGADAAVPHRSWVLVANENQLQAIDPDTVSAAGMQLTHPITNPQWMSSLLVGYDEQIVAVTNLYRFLLITPRQIAELDELGMTVNDLYHFRPLEEICTVGKWGEIREQEFLTLVTSRGFARSYRMSQLQARIENPAPYKFDHNLDGVPVAIFGSDRADQCVIVNNHGRCLRLPMNHKRLYLRGLNAMNWRDGERIMHGTHVSANFELTELALITQDGFGRRVDILDLPVVEKPNLRPPVIASRKTVQALTNLEPHAFFITTQRILPADWDKLPEANASTKTHRLLKLNSDEKLMTVLSLG